jgi:hypothetical protein
MIKEFPKTTMAVVVATWMIPSAFSLYNMIKPSYNDGLKEGYDNANKDYNDGLKEGYDNAKKEFRNNAMKSLKITNGYADDNIRSMESNESHLPREYIVSSLHLICLPKWQLEVFGEDYIVRATSDLKQKNAWIMPAKESRELDSKLRKIVSFYSTEPQITTDDISCMERETRIQMYKAIDSITKVRQ